MAQNQPIGTPETRHPIDLVLSGERIDLTLHGVQVTGVDGDVVTVSREDLPPVLLAVAHFDTAGAVSTTPALPANWPPKAGEVWYTTAPNHPDSTSRYADQIAFWLAYWDSLLGPDELMDDATETVEPEIRLINGHGDIRHPAELLAACRQSGTAQPIRYVSAGGA
jgi:hypothetical protein